MRFVEWDGHIVTASDAGAVSHDSKVIATSTALPGMVMIPTKSLLDLLNTDEVRAAAAALGEKGSA